jgi:hypothetical protein
MRAADAAIYSRALKFSLVTEDSKNSARPCRAEILNRGDGAALISVRRRHESPKGILARAPPRGEALHGSIDWSTSSLRTKR